MSAAAKAKISEAAKARFRARIETHVVEPESRPCAACGETKPLAAFYHKKRRLKSGVLAIFPDSYCKGCWGARVKARRDRMAAEGRMPPRPRENRKRDRERKRENEAARRRERGVPPRNFGRPRPQDGPKDPRLPTPPLAGFLERELERTPLAAIEAATGISERRLLDIRKRAAPTVRLSTVGAILDGLGFPEELHLLYPDRSVGYHYIPPEEGL